MYWTTRHERPKKTVKNAFQTNDLYIRNIYYIYSFEKSVGVTGMQGMQPHNLRFYERKQIYLTPKRFFLLYFKPMKCF